MNITNKNEPKCEICLLVIVDNTPNRIHDGGLRISWDGTIFFSHGNVHKSW